MILLEGGCSFKQSPKLLFELLHILEFAMHRRKADVGDFIELAECVHDVTADRRALDFLFVLPPLLLEIREHLVDVLLRNRALRTGNPDAALELLSTVRLARTIALHDDERCQLLPLERGEPMFALAALAPTPDGTSVFGETGINHGRVFVFATGATHDCDYTIKISPCRSTFTASPITSTTVEAGATGIVPESRTRSG